MDVFISGLPGSWQIASISGNTLDLTGAPIVPATGTMTVFAYDPARTGAVRMGGDDLHIGTYVDRADERRPASTLARTDGKSFVDRRLHGRPAGRHPRHRRRLDGSPSRHGLDLDADRRVRR